MSFAIFVLYGLAALISAYVMYRQPSWLMAIMFVFAAGLGLEEYEWFLPQIFSGATEWPARNFTQIFMLALRGVSDPTTVLELGLVAGGRLFILLATVYGLYFAVKYWDVIVKYVTTMQMAKLCLLLLWEGCLAVSFVIMALGVAALIPLAGVLKVLGAFVCLLYMINDLYVMIKTPPISSGPAA